MSEINRIIIIGDSFGACGDHNDAFLPTPSELYFTQTSTWGVYGPPKTFHTWSDYLKEHYQCEMNIFAYGGKSWWFSYQMFERWKQENIKLWKKTDLVIFLHTDPRRFNSQDHLVPGHSSQGPVSTCDRVGKNTISSVSTQKHTALKYHELDLYDEQFNLWAYDRFIESFPRIFKNKKMLNFTCFNYNVEQTRYCDIPVGSVVVRPSLSEISLNEYKKSVAGIPINDQRPGHFSQPNHDVFFQYLVDLIDNYQPGRFEIPLTSFESEIINA